MQRAFVIFACVTILGSIFSSASNAYPLAPHAKVGDVNLIDVGHRYYEDFYGDDDLYVPPPPPPRRRIDSYPNDTVIELVVPPPPASCGEFRYWNGTYCADARVRPPYVGPRW